MGYNSVAKLHFSMFRTKDKYCGRLLANDLGTEHTNNCHGGQWNWKWKGTDSISVKLSYKVIIPTKCELLSNSKNVTLTGKTRRRKS